MQVVPQVAPPMTFCNVRWNRDGGAAQLSREPVHLVPGEGLCRFVNGFYEIDPSLPHQEIAVAVDHGNGHGSSGRTVQKDQNDAPIIIPTQALAPDTRHPTPLAV